MTFTPTHIHETLDKRDLLDASHAPGTYALRVKTPDSTEAIARAFRAVVDVSPPDELMSQLTADSVAYVGASGDVYARLCDHARSEVRQATFLQCFAPVDVVGVWPSDTPFEEEYNRAKALSDDGLVCWVDGQVV